MYFDELLTVEQNMQKHAKQASEAGFRSLGIAIEKYEVLEFFN